MDNRMYKAMASFMYDDLRDTLGWVQGDGTIVKERIELALRRWDAHNAVTIDVQSTPVGGDMTLPLDVRHEPR